MCLYERGEIGHTVMVMGLQCIEIKPPDAGRTTHHAPIAFRIFLCPLGDDVQITRCRVAGAFEAAVFGFIGAWIYMPPK